MKKDRREDEWERNRWRKIDVEMNGKGTDEERKTWRWMWKVEIDERDGMDSNWWKLSTSSTCATSRRIYLGDLAN